MDKVLLSSKKMNWRTPHDFFQSLQGEFNFTLDAASDDANCLCSKHFTESDNALEQSWATDGVVWCNPPYGRGLRNWVQKADVEATKGVTTVMLIPARTDTSYFHDFIYNKHEVRFLRGRLRFLNDDNTPSDPAPFPSMLVIFRP